MDPLQQIDTCVFLVAGRLGRINTIHASLIEADNVGGCSKSINSVYLNQTQSPAFNSTDDQCIETKRGPLQMFRWQPEKK